MVMTRRQFLGAAVSAVVATSGLESLAGETTTQPTKKKIVLDPGHGMGYKNKEEHDPGSSYGEFKESEIVLDQAERIGKILTERGYDVHYTRTDEATDVRIFDRPRIANEFRGDLVVSLHVDSSHDKNVGGVDVLYRDKSDEGKDAASKIRKSLVDELSEKVVGFEDKGRLKDARFLILSKSRAPAVFVESGFLSNERDRKYLTEQPEIVARGIAKGIIKYFSDE